MVCISDIPTPTRSMVIPEMIPIDSYEFNYSLDIQKIQFTFRDIIYDIFYQLDSSWAIILRTNKYNTDEKFYGLQDGANMNVYNILDVMGFYSCKIRIDQNDVPLLEIPLNQVNPFQFDITEV